MKSVQRRKWLQGALALSPVAWIACSSEDGGNAAPNQTQSAAGTSSGNAVVQINEISWDSAKIAGHIYRILVTEQLQLVSEMSPVPEEKTGDKFYWLEFAEGRKHVEMEVWPSTENAQFSQTTMDGQVERVGPLGGVGKVGWYVPKYLVQKNPKVASWEAFKDPEVIQLITPPGGMKGRLLHGTPDWGTFDEDLIANLALNLIVDYLGDEDKLTSEIEALYAKEIPFLTYLWIPHRAIVDYDLVEIQLPPHDPDIWTKANEGEKVLNCDYPTEKLEKACWGGFKTYSPKAYQLLQKFTLTTKDQIDQLSNLFKKSLTHEQAARAWITANEAIWKTWV
jgi:glycine betaine/proline transport system substrate-binding protein